ncbi:hypothetical protein AX16_004160 [Volvariella volvacea WC 439]|nr:hypothetical protein AX16_004160 [Volvariella volvacea WC 439]
MCTPHEGSCMTCYELNRFIFVILVLVKIWDGLEAVVLLSFSSKLLNLIEEGLKNGKPDTDAILRATLTRLFVALFASTFRWWSKTLQARIDNQMSLFYQDIVLNVRLKKDISAAKDDDNATWNPMQMSATKTWEALAGLATRSFSVASQIGFLVHMATSRSGGPLFVVCCVTRPIVTLLSQKTLWDVAHVVHVVNPNYQRMRKLKQIAGGTYREEVVSGNLINWIRRELRKTIAALRDTPLDYPEALYSMHSTPFHDMITTIAEDLPIISGLSWTLIENFTELDAGF